MLKKTFLLAIATSIVLVGCSEEVVSDNEETVKKVTSSEVIENEPTTNSTSGENEQQSLAIEDVTSPDEGETTVIEEESNKTSSSVKNVVKAVEEQVDFYTIYSSGEAGNDSSLEIKLDESNEKLTYKQLDDDVIELPKVKGNETVLENRVEEVAVAELREKEVISFMEEPVTKGNLIVVDIGKLKTNYVAISYSFLYNGKEYGMMVSDKKEEIGLFLIENSEGMLEDIQKNGIINVIN